MSKKKATAISLPISRTAKIMASAQGVEKVNPDIVALATKATEIFLMDFAKRAYDQSSDEEFRSNVLEYDDLQRLVHRDPRYDFLTDTYPKRIKFSEALKLVRKQSGDEAGNKNNNDHGGDHVKSEDHDDKLKPEENDLNNHEPLSDNDNQISRDEDSDDHNHVQDHTDHDDHESHEDHEGHEEHDDQEGHDGLEYHEDHEENGNHEND